MHVGHVRKLSVKSSAFMFIVSIRVDDAISHYLSLSHSISIAHNQLPIFFPILIYLKLNDIFNCDPASVGFKFFN